MVRFPAIACVIVLACSWTAAVAQQPTNDLVNCRWKDGRPMTERDCSTLRRVQAQDDAERQKQDAQLQAAREREAQRRAQKQEDQRKAAEASEQRRAEEQARDEAQRRATEEMLAKEAAEEERQAKVASQRAAALRTKCGADYRAPRVGMSFDRMKECAGPVKLYSEIQRADGVISIYTSPSGMVHVLHGQVVAWTRL